MVSRVLCCSSAFQNWHNFSQGMRLSKVPRANLLAFLMLHRTVIHQLVTWSILVTDRWAFHSNRFHDRDQIKEILFADSRLPLSHPVCLSSPHFMIRSSAELVGVCGIDLPFFIKMSARGLILGWAVADLCFPQKSELMTQNFRYLSRKSFPVVQSRKKRCWRTYCCWRCQGLSLSLAQWGADTSLGLEPCK